ncbi:TFIIA-alpha and beta-like factor isoform X2 [Centropristis striata]|uniref:TFIIA-alpha and beta-like factor isoform X2 n=1 Tax=Centropristis striata TaxID=184440 RepID=UPI0027DFAABE|nr:TFIIA-alpha and beta-like factor isoform X2 [Centropristis striata]
MYHISRVYYYYYRSAVVSALNHADQQHGPSGLEDRVLDDLRHLWESKMMQSKAMEDFRKNNINSSNFVLQLPANYSQTDQELTASVVIPASQNIRSFPMKNNSETLATFSLPAGLPYPVQIPAGVTLQTASGQLYKVNVPVVVTQAPAGQRPVSQPTHKVTEQREAQPAAAPTKATHPQEVERPSVPASSVTQPPPHAPSQESSIRQQPQVPAAGASQLQGAQSPEPEVTLEENEPSPQSEPVNLSMTASPCSQLLDFQIRTEEALTQSAQLKTRDIDDILKEVIEEEREKAERARNLAPAKTNNQTEAVLGLDLDYNYNELSDIVQLDGPAGNSDIEEGEGVLLEENDFLGIINAEAIKALQEGGGSSDSISSSSDGEGADELADVEEEDPLNSGDDVIEQDIPDLFDTDNVIVCQYDKIHRSKNRWKFHLKDVVMCYGGRDYVFSKAVGEAEW